MKMNPATYEVMAYIRQAIKNEEYRSSHAGKVEAYHQQLESAMRDTVIAQQHMANPYIPGDMPKGYGERTDRFWRWVHLDHLIMTAVIEHENIRYRQDDTDIVAFYEKRYEGQS